VKATRTHFSSRGPAAKRGTVLKVRLRKQGRIEIVVRGSDCSVLGRRFVRGHKGLNRVRFDGRVHGRPLAPGRYSLSVVVIRGHTRKALGAIGIEVVPPGRRLTKAQRSAPVSLTCFVRSSASPQLPAAVVSTAAPRLTVVRSSSEPRSQPAAVKSKSRGGGVLGVSLRPPHVLVTPGGAPGWLGVVLVVIFGFALTALVVYAARFIRGSIHL